MSTVVRTVVCDGGDRGVRMSTIGVVRDLSELFLWVGIAGTGFALLCAIIAAVALAVGSAGVAGGASAVWIVGAMLSLTSGFSGQWLPAIITAAALPIALILGAIARKVVRRFERQPSSESDAADEPTAAPAPVATRPAVTAPRLGGVRTVTSESIR